MYRLVLYFLVILLVEAVVLSFIGILPFNAPMIIFTVILLTTVAWLTNAVFGYFFESTTNVESVYISALILALIIPPLGSLPDIGFLVWAAVWISASKFILAIDKKHLFNPVAISVLMMSTFLGQSANWWVGSKWFFFPVLIGGFLIVRKIRRPDLVISFTAAAMSGILIGGLLKGADLISLFQRTLINTPLLFMATVMLTEPFTTPSRKWPRIFYGILVGVLFNPQIHIGSFYTTPESALVMGNLFSFFISPFSKRIATFKQKVELAKDTFGFIFTPNRKLAYLPGQYIEWTLPQKHYDSRGNRRYFTIASSPTEADIELGVKFYPNPSEFKKSLSELPAGQKISIGNLAGDFTLPEDTGKKLVFIAGGIGVTPFRSMIKYLLDTKQKRDIVLFYSNKTQPEIAYKNIFDQAAQEIGLKTIYSLSDETQLPPDWKGDKGFLTAEKIQQFVPDFKERTYYISGPHGMVAAFEKTLAQLGVPKLQIKTDYFPGF